MSIISTIFKQEWQRQWRGRVMPWLLVLNVLLVALVAGVHIHQQQSFAATQAHWQAVNDDLWRNQPERHPHRVAHYGSIAFRQHAPLNFIDAGVNPYVGNVLFLEAHRQNSSGLKQFTISASELGLGYLSIATLVLVLWPLVLVMLAHGSLSDERKQGNLNVLQSLGVRPWQMVLGKGLVYVVISGLYLLVLALIAAGFVAASSATGGSDLWVRLVLTFGLYFGYTMLWVAAIMLVSLNARDNTQSLMLSLSLWLFWVVLWPRLLTGVVASLHPTPSRSVFDVQLAQAVAKLGDSHNPDDPYFSAFRQKMLDQYQVEKVEDLPVNWRGLVMQEGEKLGKQVFDEQVNDVLGMFKKQDQTYRVLSVLSPYAWTTNLSSGLTGTRTEDYWDFEQQAEHYRYDLISRLNQLHAEEVAFKEDKKTKLDTHHWQAFQPFQHVMKPWQWPSGWLLTIFAGCLLWLDLGVFAYRRGIRIQ